MKALRASIARLAGLLPGTGQDGELAAELDAHLRMHIADNIRSGMKPGEARRAALMKLGGVETTMEAYRERGTVPFLEHFWQDARFSIRQLRKNPGFTATAVVMLALGLCASVAIFAFVDAALIKPLPYRDPSRLAGVYEKTAAFPQSNLSYPDYLDWKKMNVVFSSLDIYQRRGLTLRTAGGVEPTRGARVTGGFFRTLGVVPALGRDFLSGEDLPGAQRIVLLSYGAWQQRYGGRPDVLGQTVTLDDQAYSIIGVLPKNFHFAPAEPADFWVALQAESECDLRRSCHSTYGVARLKDGVSFETALANVQAIAKQLEVQYPGSNKEQGGTLMPLSEAISGYLRKILLMLLSGAGLLLLIASINVASLVLVRSESRRREMSVRAALGASRGRLIGQFVTEGLILTIAGTVLGLILSTWTMKLLVHLIPQEMLRGMPFLIDLGLNVRILAFAGVVAILAAMLFSFLPAFRLSMPEVRDGLAEGTRGSAGVVWRRLGTKLVVLELATAVVLLVGAGLLGKSLYQLLQVNPGFPPDHLVTLEIHAPERAYGKDPQAVNLGRKLIDTASSLPGVQSAGFSSDLPISHWGNTTWFRIVGKPWHGEHNDTPERDVSSNYFRTLGATLLRGRYFTESDDATKPKVAIVNQAFAKQYFPNEDVVGKQISPLEDPPKPIEIVGLVADVKEGQLDTTNRPVLYFPFNQNTGRDIGLVVRTSQDSNSLLQALAASVRQIDPDLVMRPGASMRSLMDDSPSAYFHRSSAWLVGGFAVIALLLSVVGLYGVVAYSVSQRTREIGVRMALGAQPGAVHGLILKEAAWLAGAGIVIGLGCAVGAAELMSGLLFGVGSWDIPTLALVAAVLGVSALLASYIPAHRAAAVNPVEALRAE